MQASPPSRPISLLARTALRCRGCLGVLVSPAEAGLCGHCWQGLIPPPEGRCPRCALPHDADRNCPEPTDWTLGDALWDYHGGRPPLGALIVPGIKEGELGWKTALLGRLKRIELPSWTADVELVTCAPTALHRRWMRGFDLAEEAARQLANRLGIPFAATLKKGLFHSRQAERTESQRRRLPRKAITLRRTATIEQRIILLVDDVWTTGTTLLRCAQALQAGGAAEVRVLTLFRAL
jgi:predicted amidophosphoribosyltransferase